MPKKILVPLAALLLLCGGGYALAYRLVLAGLVSRTYNMLWVKIYFYCSKPMLCLSGSFLAVWCGRDRIFKEQEQAVRRIFRVIGLAVLAACLAVAALVLTAGLRPPFWVMAALFHPLPWLFSGALLGLGVDRPQG